MGSGKTSSLPRSNAFLSLVLLSLVLALAASCGAKPTIATAPEPSNDVRPSVDAQATPEHNRSEDLYERAMALRFVSVDDTDDPLSSRSVMTTNKDDLKRSIYELYAAAGVVHLSMNTSSNPGALYHTADDVEVRWRHGKIQHIDAVRELVYAFRSGTGTPINPAIAHKLVRELAAAGVAEFQCDLGSIYSVGVEPVAQNRDNLMFILREPDLDMAMLHYSFAAKAQDPVAQMALGFRHMHGIGVEKSCHAAAIYYEQVASGVVSSATTDGGLPTDSGVRLLDRKPTDGLKPVPTEEQEMLHYQWFADYGHAEAAKAVAHLLTHGEEQNLAAALEYLMQAAEMGDADAMAHIGHAYANGIAVAQSNSTAKSWFIKAAEKGHPSGMFGLGVMHLKGQGVHVDHETAARYLKRAITVDKEWAGRSDAFFYAGYMALMGWGMPKDIPLALQWLDRASRGGNLLASYNLAGLLLTRGDNCDRAVKLLKSVAERGWGSLSEAASDFETGDYGWALYNFLRAADVGVELAQHNAAWMLSNGYGYNGEGSAELAARMYKWSAVQGNTAALVPLGDAYWYGRGMDVDLKKAGDMYKSASQLNIGRASFNLGYMHEHGLGLPKDMDLAKKYYRQAMKGPGYLPGALAVSWLRVHDIWQTTKDKLPTSVVAFVDGALNSVGVGAGFNQAGSTTTAPPAVDGSAWGVSDMLQRIEQAVDSTMLVWLTAVVAVIVSKLLLRNHAR